MVTYKRRRNIIFAKLSLSFQERKLLMVAIMNRMDWLKATIKSPYDLEKQVELHMLERLHHRIANLKRRIPAHG